MYRPNTVNVPLFKEKNELSVNAGASSNGANIQAAYSVTEHFAVMVNGSFYNANVTTPTGISRIENNFGEAGIGYFSHLGENFIGEIYSGFGMGKAYNQNDYWIELNSFNRVDFNKIFVQPSIGFVSNIFELAASIRWSYLDYYNFKSDSPINYGNLPNRSANMFIEPALTARAGYKSVKVFAQTGFAMPTMPITYSFSPFMFSLGVNIKLAPRYKVSLSSNN
ncbi:MAG: hypothetical protein ACK4IK_08455 [Bacteroidia bacterium]